MTDNLLLILGASCLAAACGVACALLGTSQEVTVPLAVVAICLVALWGVSK